MRNPASPGRWEGKSSQRPFTVSQSKPDQERGIALIIVIFIVALASILAINLAYSSFIGARRSATSQRAVQAEYFLKSALNFSRVLLKEDTTTEDSLRDNWAFFFNGSAIPTQALGLQEPNVTISLEIRPEESKLPLATLLPSPSTDLNKKWHDAFLALFTALQFDQDGEKVESGRFAGKFFDSQMLVANLIDYMDADTESFPQGGMEKELPKDFFPNQVIRKLTELEGIPGFTAQRIRRLSPFVTAGGSSNRVNINVAPALVIRSLSPQMTNDVVAQIMEKHSMTGEPFKDLSEAKTLFDSNSISIESMYAIESKWFQVIAKVEYGTTQTYFLRAVLNRESLKTLPKVISAEYF